MLDAKVLAAVLASLAAVAVTMNGGGSVDPQISDVPQTGNSMNFDSFLPDPVQKVRDALVSKPEPETSVQATLDVGNLDNEVLRVKKAHIRIDNLTSVQLTSNRLDSDETVSFHGFEGTVKPGEKSQLNGRAGSVTTSGVNVSGGITVVQELETESIELEGVERSAIRFSEVTGEISSGAASTEFGNATRALRINSFSGDITVYPSNSTVKLDGKVDRLEAGAFSFGN